RELGLNINIYPTFNSGKSESRIATDKVMAFINKNEKRWTKLGPDDEANGEQVLAFCRERKGWQAYVMETAQFVHRDGQEYVVSHVPFPRFRVLVPFTKPLRIADISPTLTGAKAKWKA